MPKLTEEQKKQQQEQQGEVAAAVVAEQPTAQPAEVAAEATTQQPQGNWYDAIEKAYAERMKADERADKRDRVRASIAGIGDVASALSNLYFTTQYAPNVPQGDTMSAAQRERADKMKASRDRNRAEWMNYMLNIAGRKQAAEQAEANRKTTERYHNTIIAQREAAAQAAADAKAAAAEVKDAEKWAKSYEKMWEGAALDGTLDYEAAEKWIDENAGSEARKTAAKNVLRNAVGSASTKKNYYQYQQENKVSTGRRGGGNSGSTDTEIFTHRPGEKITLSKAAMNGTALPVSELQRLNDSQINRMIRAKQYKQAFEYFFNSNKYTEAAKTEMARKLMAARDAKEATSQSTQSGNNTPPSRRQNNSNNTNTPPSRR